MTALMITVDRDREVPLLDVLQGARQLITDPERWAQCYSGYFPKNDVRETTVDRGCYCLSGALQKAAGGEISSRSWPLILDALRLPMICDVDVRTRGDIVRYNDHPLCRHADVLGVLDAAVSAYAKAAA